MNFTEIRLRIRHFFRKNKRLIFVIVIIWAIIFCVNLLLKNRKVELAPTTTYKPHVSVLDSSSSTPKAMQTPIEDMIKEYVDACNDGNYQKAFDMLSDDCKKYAFDNDVEKFMVHVLIKMPMPKKYSIQDYSSTKIDNQNMYIYEVKYIDDYLATGLTNSTYAYTSEKFVFYNGDDGLTMNVGDYIYHSDIKSLSENDSLKIDVVDKTVQYEIEKYRIRFLNRTDKTAVVSDGVENDEINLVLQTGERRNRQETNNIVLKPFEEKELEMTFPKFSDDGDISQSLQFNQIRVMEQYSGTEDVDEATIQDEINNADKFAMEVKVAK